ncbi:hypothetical protein ABIA71_003577 [Stenotrophomonas sp. 2619]|uniref:hypothetical protein n=1 Tax=Stenotrophomonas sp. 2619 TaxID=3156316 RepID=UPI00339AED9B
MSRIVSITAIGLLLAVATVPLHAQSGKGEAKAKKLYCWNKGSERICSDTLPQEAINNAREEFSATSGLRRGEVERTLTEEERADAAVAAAQRQLDLAAEETRQRTEQAMLSTYENENDLRRVFVERTGIIDNNVQTARYNVASLRDALVSLLGTAGDRELAGQPVIEKHAASIRQRHTELVAQLRMQNSFEQQRRALDVEIEETLQRYRLLKGVSTDPRG